MDSAEKNSLAVGLEQIGLHDHLCLLYETKDEQFAALAPFIRIGLGRHEKCVYIADDNGIDAVLDALQQRGIDSQAAVHSGALAIMARQDAYCQEERFNPDSAIDFLIKSTAEAKKAGFAALRLMGEMTWALSGDRGGKRLKEYGAKLNRVLPTIDALAICQINRNCFAPHILLDVIHTHPIVAFDGSICRNFYYVPPEEFRSPNQSAHLVERLLSNIRERAQEEKALHEGEERFRTVAEFTYDWEYWRSPAGKLLYVSPSCERVTGYRADEFIENPDLLEKIVHPDDREIIVQHHIESGVPHEPVSLDFRIITRSGDERWIAHNCQTVYGADGAWLGRRVSNRDITERKRAEEAVQGQRALAEALRDTAAALSSTLDLDEVLDRILANVGKVVPHDTASFMLLEDEVGHIIRARGFAERGLQDWILSKQFWTSELSSFRQMAETKEPVVIADTQAEPSWTTLPGLGWIRSYVGTPIVVTDKVIGFLSLDSSAPGAFTLEHAERLRAFAEQAAIAIHNARLYEDAQRRAEELEALRQVALSITGQLDLETLLEQLVIGVLRLLDIPSGGIYLYRPELDMLEWAFSIGPRMVPLGSKLRRGEGLSGKVWETGKPLFVDDYATWEGRSPAYVEYDFGSVLGAPIQWGGELLGVFNTTTGKGHPRKFTERDAHLLSLFADQAAIAMQNARLYEAERHERLATQTLQKTAESLASTTRPEGTLELIVGQLGQIVSFDRALVMLTDGDVLRIVAARGFSEPDQVLGATYPYADHRLFCEVMMSDKAVSIADVRQDSRWDPSLLLEAATRAWLGAPLTASEVSLGLLSISRDQPQPFGPDDLEMVQASAQQAALAVRGAQIVASLEASLTELRQAQSHLARTAQLHVAGEIATGIAHQVNNPLTTIIAESYLLLKQLPSDSPGYESAESIKEAAYRAGTVVQRLLDFARSNPYDFQLLDVNDSIRHAVSLVRAQIEPQIARVAMDLQPDLPLIEASREHLEDVWLNLLLNARDAIDKPAEGIIKVTAKHDVPNDTIQVVVQDNGSGISPGNMERLFTPFFTTKGYGTGLGLAICRDVLTRHGGSIRAESEKGRGARFIVTLPLGRKHR